MVQVRRGWKVLSPTSRVWGGRVSPKGRWPLGGSAQHHPHVSPSSVPAHLRDYSIALYTRFFFSSWCKMVLNTSTILDSRDKIFSLLPPQKKFPSSDIFIIRITFMLSVIPISSSDGALWVWQVSGSSISVLNVSFCLLRASYGSSSNNLYDYVNAEHYGRAYGDCWAAYPQCPMSLFKLFDEHNEL